MGASQGYPGLSIFDSLTFAREVILGRQAANFAIDWTEGNCQALTLGASGLTISAPAVGVGWFQLKVTQDGAGSRTLPTFSPAINWEGGTPPTLATAAGAVNFLNFYCDGKNFFGVMDSGSSAAASSATPRAFYTSAVEVTAPASIANHIMDTIPIPAATLGANDYFRIVTEWDFTNNANSKTVTLTFGGTSICQATATSMSNMITETFLWAKNSTAAQRACSKRTNESGSLLVTATGTVIDTTAAQDLLVRCTKTVAGDTVRLFARSVELFRA